MKKVFRIYCSKHVSGSRQANKKKKNNSATNNYAAMGCSQNPALL